jgi:hypothetical protein
MTERETGAPVHKSGAIPADVAPSQPAAEMPAGDDLLTALDAGARRTLTVIADRLIPAAHGMPSAADVVGDERLRFVLGARPDLVEPLHAALRPELGDDPQLRLTALERDEPANLAAVQLVIVAGYYTDGQVRELIGYPGQLAIEARSGEIPPYVEEGLIDAVLARGPVWRDPATGQRAEGGNNGRQGS